MTSDIDFQKSNSRVDLFLLMISFVGHGEKATVFEGVVHEVCQLLC